jgi:hypothetical protein
MGLPLVYCVAYFLAFYDVRNLVYFVVSLLAYFVEYELAFSVSLLLRLRPGRSGVALSSYAGQAPLSILRGKPAMVSGGSPFA